MILWKKLVLMLSSSMVRKKWLEREVTVRLDAVLGVTPNIALSSDTFAFEGAAGFDFGIGAFTFFPNTNFSHILIAFLILSQVALWPLAIQLACPFLFTLPEDSPKKQNEFYHKNCGDSVLE
jgi:hypothetical protein